MFILVLLIMKFKVMPEEYASKDQGGLEKQSDVFVDKRWSLKPICH